MGGLGIGEQKASLRWGFGGGRKRCDVAPDGGTTGGWNGRGGSDRLEDFSEILMRGLRTFDAQAWEFVVDAASIGDLTVWQEHHGFGSDGGFGVDDEVMIRVAERNGVQVKLAEMAGDGVGAFVGIGVDGVKLDGHGAILGYEPTDFRSVLVGDGAFGAEEEENHGAVGDGGEWIDGLTLEGLGGGESDLGFRGTAGTDATSCPKELNEDHRGRGERQGEAREWRGKGAFGHGGGAPGNWVKGRVALGHGVDLGRGLQDDKWRGDGGRATGCEATRRRGGRTEL